ncbi:response regulator [Fulvivirgaceae bacterium BMA12]|uniref:Response regulator n=1 Tax=Agaribacillus aureus TaxID=3051825 RepID=A0ABT8L344_9BACT|nr:response regulator [Fulvivirgaceae bacterium BMA12]
MNKTILIADDSESIRQLVSATLESSGYSVLVSVDGEDALTYLDGSIIDLVITDLNMPKLDGIGVVKGIREKEQYKFIPVLMLTTESQASKKEAAKKAGATGWIVKPFVEDKLLAVVKKVLR